MSRVDWSADDLSAYERKRAGDHAPPPKRWRIGIDIATGEEGKPKRWSAFLVCKADLVVEEVGGSDGGYPSYPTFRRDLRAEIIPDWISVSDPPKKSGRYQVLMEESIGERKVEIYHYTAPTDDEQVKSRWLSDGFESPPLGWKITHWQELPATEVEE